jgi:formylglycine-generating enzyme required for sulfatase activity
MTGKTVVGSAVMVALLASCGSSAAPAPTQLIVYIDTDAIVPSNVPSAFSFMNPVPLFDHVLIEGIHDGETCASCSRDFDVFKETFEAKSVSFGVLPPLVAGDRIRVRLYLSRYVEGGGIPSEIAVDVTASLPSMPALGETPLTLFLPTEGVGQSSTGVLTPGMPTTSQVGSWSGAKRIACGSPPAPGEVCVPGGAFWMGNPFVAHAGNQDGDRLRLVVVSPFFIDSTEVTVGEYREAALDVGDEWSGQVACELEDYCTFTSSPGPYERFPLNCVEPAEAVTYCGLLGKKLPTEAEFEYVASGLASQTYVWGEDPPACSDAILARSGLGYFYGYDGFCLENTPRNMACMVDPSGGLGLGQGYGGPALPQMGLRDRITLDLPSSSGTVYDLVGNLSEIMRDSFEPLTGSCWSAPGVYRDPVCSSGAAVSLRGGDWTANGADARAASRNVVPNATDAGPQSGFRCVRDTK